VLDNDTLDNDTLDNDDTLDDDGAEHVSRRAVRRLRRRI
jgi:hypothetical protein